MEFSVVVFFFLRGQKLTGSLLEAISSNAVFSAKSKGPTVKTSLHKSVKTSPTIPFMFLLWCFTPQSTILIFQSCRDDFGISSFILQNYKIIVDEWTYTVRQA